MYSLRKYGVISWVIHINIPYFLTISMPLKR
ncbi:hypothetical protein predicted by Glimmer/Critica [Helicobacter pylori B8]|uniref:Uncharacterized protein n=1 Tax=Helicobacter pylori (strain B8) TaxID=693745 RepID=D7FEJ2_HELP3|nr:hypothetical protein predicted by Glimmer/Critica [Helicobacter pylori B8]